MSYFFILLLYCYQFYIKRKLVFDLFLRTRLKRTNKSISRSSRLYTHTHTQLHKEN